MKIGSLCCGIGGIDLGFIEQGFNVAWAIDSDDKACRTYKHNLGKNVCTAKLSDALEHEFDFTPVDVIVAGFPCQAFSITGKQKGFNHEQGTVFFDVWRIIKQVQPKAILLENVKNILFHDEGKTHQVIIGALRDLGYHVMYQIINTKLYTCLPQNREQWYLVAFKDINDSFNFHFPLPTQEPRLSIKEILEPTADNYYNLLDTNYQTIREGITKQFVCYHWRRSYLRENKSGVCPTLTANMGKGGSNVPIIDDGIGIRPLTLRECLRLQGFPESYEFPPSLKKAVCYKQIGNSVSVPIISRIAEQIKNVLTL
jgi:DNA (cytosine-5)-methyltransferase 1